MPEFMCRVASPTGDVFDRNFVAADESELRRDLENQDLMILDVMMPTIEDGLGNPELLLVKAGLDGFAAIAFASVYGWGWPPQPSR